MSFFPSLRPCAPTVPRLHDRFGLGCRIVSNVGHEKHRPLVVEHVAEVVDSALHSPTQYTWNFTIERQLPKGGVFSASYIGRAGRSLLARRDAAGEHASIEYGVESTMRIAWDDEAAERMKRIPAFVRGMVVRAVENSCRRNGISRVTAEELERIRARMPTSKVFG